MLRNGDCRCRTRKFLKKMAGTTRLELATSAVTGQRSNQLNYVPGSQSSVGQKAARLGAPGNRNRQEVVGSAGLEPATFCL